jgi:hypothetical protein
LRCRLLREGVAAQEAQGYRSATHSTFGFIAIFQNGIPAWPVRDVLELLSLYEKTVL